MTIETKIVVMWSEEKFIEILDGLVKEGKAELVGEDTRSRVYRIGSTVTEGDVQCILD